MIISPSIEQVLRGIIHEMGGSLKEGLDPVKTAQIDTIIGVLGSCAVRVDNQSKFIRDEVDAIRSLALEFKTHGQSNPMLETGLSAMATANTDLELYETASQTLSAMSDIGLAAGKELSEKLHVLFEMRLGNEAQIIGGGFEAAGRG
jgi:hypothetical protein